MAFSWLIHGNHSLTEIILQVQPYKLTTTRFILHPSHHPFRDHVPPGLISTVPTHLVESTSSKVLRQRWVKLLSQKKTEIEYPISIKNWMGPNPNGPLSLGVRSVGPVGDFLDLRILTPQKWLCWGPQTPLRHTGSNPCCWRAKGGFLGKKNGHQP